MHSRCEKNVYICTYVSRTRLFSLASPVRLSADVVPLWVSRFLIFIKTCLLSMTFCFHPVLAENLQLKFFSCPDRTLEIKDLENTQDSGLQAESISGHQDSPHSRGSRELYLISSLCPSHFSFAYTYFKRNFQGHYHKWKINFTGLIKQWTQKHKPAKGTDDLGLIFPLLVEKRV